MLIEELMILLMRSEVNIEILPQHDNTDGVTIVMRKRGKIQTHCYSITIQPHTLPTEEYKHIINEGIERLKNTIECDEYRYL